MQSTARGTRPLFLQTIVRHELIQTRMPLSQTCSRMHLANFVTLCSFIAVKPMLARLEGVLRMDAHTPEPATITCI